MRGERGVALLEVLVALAILASAGSAFVVLLAEQARGIETLHQREAELRGADAILTQLSLQDAHQLDIRLGRRAVGNYATDVQRPRPGLYRLAVASADAPDAELLVTVVHRGGVQ